jgi:hypothetical protein
VDDLAGDDAHARNEHPIDYFLAILPLEYWKGVALNSQRDRGQRAMLNPESYPHVNHQTLCLSRILLFLSALFLTGLDVVPQKRKLFENSFAFPGHRVGQMFSRREFEALCSFFPYHADCLNKRHGWGDNELQTRSVDRDSTTAAYERPRGRSKGARLTASLCAACILVSSLTSSAHPPPFRCLELTVQCPQKGRDGSGSSILIN